MKISIFFSQTTEKQKEENIALLEEEENRHHIILYNDDVNTFDWVIECLVKICKHSSIQAEQCAWIVHHNGKCDIKSGSYDELKPLCSALLEKGLSAKIE